MDFKRTAIALICVFSLSACSMVDHTFAPSMQKTSINKPAPFSAPPVTGKRKIGKPYKILGKTYYPISSSEGYRRKGVASWYGKDFHAKKTANGETYNMYDMTAAHPTLPIPTYVRVTNLDNGLSTVVRVNDRGPFLRGRVIDLSYKAAITLDMAEKGTAPVLLEALPTDGSVLRVNNNFEARTRHVKQKVTYLPAPVGGSFTNRISGISTPSVISEDVDLSANEVVEIGAVNVYVQTGAFSDKQNAVREQKNVANIYSNTKLTSFYRGTQKLHRVRIGPLKSVSIADSVLANIISNGWPTARIVID